MENKTVSVKSIRMDDEDYQLIKIKAEESHMTIGKFLVKAACQKQGSIAPEVLCKLTAIANALEYPDFMDDEQLKNNVIKDIRTVCEFILKL